MATIEVTEYDRVTSEGRPMADLLPDGTRVEVRNRLDGTWSRGFEIAGHGGDGYRLRRLSDGGLLPVGFAEDDVRTERERKRGTWWY